MGFGFILAIFIIGYYIKDLFKVVALISLVALFYFYGVEALEIILNIFVSVITYLRGVFE